MHWHSHGSMPSTTPPARPPRGRPTRQPMRHPHLLPGPLGRCRGFSAAAAEPRRDKGDWVVPEVLQPGPLEPSAVRAGAAGGRKGTDKRAPEGLTAQGGAKRLHIREGGKENRDPVSQPQGSIESSNTAASPLDSKRSRLAAALAMPTGLQTHTPSTPALLQSPARSWQLTPQIGSHGEWVPQATPSGSRTGPEPTTRILVTSPSTSLPPCTTW